MMYAILLFPLLPLATILEIFMRIICVLFYPLAYRLRTWPRTRKDWAWELLDDTIVLDSIMRGAGPLEYCCYGKREPLGFITERLPEGKFKEFMRAYNWGGGWRNAGINFMRETEVWIGSMKETIYHFQKGKFIYEVRMFVRLALPYLEYRFGKDGTGVIQCGWISCGRFQTRFRTHL